ncbi:MAG: galactokinase family protein, partial [Eubacteriales bacterium]|nr:galactokinase family protein [Eubacteriales bacterium]
MKTTELKKALATGGLDGRLSEIYGAQALAGQKMRYLRAVEEFEALYGRDREAALYSVAGRSELSGNHTDHNHGCVVAASIDLDIIAVASASAGSVIRVKSEGFPEDAVDFDAYSAPDPARYGKSASLIAGMVAGFCKEGLQVGGFDAYTTSNVLKGSGISSSAAFEDMIGNILNYEYNGGRVSNVEIAKLAQYAENRFFGKPC